MFVLEKSDEELAKSYLRREKKPFTKFMPVQYKGMVYNARVFQNAYKKLMKRGNGVYITKITFWLGVITIHYRTETGQGKYAFHPIVEEWKGYTPQATIEHPIEFI